MKKRLVSVLLALTLCGALVLPAFAEQAEELPTPEESEIFPAEEILDFPDLTEAEVGEVRYSHIHWVEEYEIEEPLDGTEGEEMGVAKWQTGYLCSDESCPYNAAVVEGVFAAGQSGPGICPYCGKENWSDGWNDNFRVSSMNKDYHTITWTVFYRCNTEGCTGVCEIIMGKKPYEPHSWNKGSLNGYRSSNAVAHVAVYNYSCSVCGATKTEPESSSEPHSMREVGYTGNNYHQGTMHYFEYEYECTQCGYTKTQYKSYSCPGPQGGGCILPDTPINRVEPPVEIQDLTEPEETIVSE